MDLESSRDLSAEARGILHDILSLREAPKTAVIAARLQACMSMSIWGFLWLFASIFILLSHHSGTWNIMDLVVTKRRSARQLAGRKRSIYYESDSDDEAVHLLSDEYSDDDSVAGDPAPPPPPPRPQRSRKRVRAQKPVTRSKKAKPSKGAEPRERKQGRNRPLGTFPKRKSKPARVDSIIPSDGVKPAWRTLPVEILRDIFIFASQPLHEQSPNGSGNTTWLMKTARMTNIDFAIPALEAYYLSPAFHAVIHPHHLLELLQLPPDKTYIKYRQKVRRLEVDVKHLAYSAQSRSLFNLSALVQELPQLQQLEVIHPVDEPPYRPLKLQRWFYPADLFDAMDESEIRLRVWRWSRDMMNYPTPEDMYREMTRTHSRRCFERLDRLLVCGFDYNDSAEPKAPVGEKSQPPNLTSALASLPALSDLTLLSCDIVMEDFLLRLPSTLERLELTNCLEITSEILYTYLMTNGSNLRELVLNSNAALNLSFLAGLKQACPKLEVLTMDTTYYSERTNYNDAYAFYDHLLTAKEVPSWPSTLRRLEFSNLQKWGADAASTLFQSLIDAAPELPDLRHLTIQAHIDIAWRDRADFRDTWVDKIRAVFLHETPPPLAYLCSLKRYREWKEEQPLPPRSVEAGDDAESAQRRLSHVRITPRKPTADHRVVSDSEDDAVGPRRSRIQPRRSTRVAESQSAASVSATPNPDTSGSGDEDDGDGPSGIFVQGLCEVVDIRIDNQRPRETQYTEANFLDSELSGDEDWHSGADLSDDGYAW